MAALGEYTNTDAVRGSLGIDRHDCPDAYFSDSDLEKELIVDLDDWIPTHATVYEDGKPSAATVEAKKSKTLLELYSQWFCAYEMASRPLTFLKAVSDGKNQAKRYDLDLAEVKKAAADKKAHYRALLDEAVNSITDTSATPTSLLSVSELAEDPITGA